MRNSACSTCLARALTNRAVKLEHFVGDTYRDPDVQALLPRIHAAPHPEMRMDNSGEHFGAEVRVTLTDGRVLAQRVRQAIGRGVANPLPAELLEAKFLDCASRVLPEAKAQRLLTLLRGLEEVDDLSLDVGDRLAAG